jgi:hypothetical protein
MAAAERGAFRREAATGVGGGEAWEIGGLDSWEEMTGEEKKELKLVTGKEEETEWLHENSNFGAKQGRTR